MADTADLPVTYQGCGGWDEFRALFPGTALETLPEPARVVTVEVERTDILGQGMGVNGRAIWHDGAAYWSMDGRHVAGDKECHYMSLDEMSDEDALHNMLNHYSSRIQADDDSVHLDGARTAAWHETINLASRLGIRIIWAVEQITGDSYDSYKHVVAIYDDERMACRHVRAAEMYEQVMPVDDEWEGPSSWCVRSMFRRDGLPPELVGYDDGTLSVPPFPTRMETTTVEDAQRPWLTPKQWTVDVPSRGSVTFKGNASNVLSARFLCTLPDARPTSYHREKAANADWSMRGMVPVMGGEGIVHWGGHVTGSIVSKGVDASALLVDAFNLALVCASTRFPSNDKPMCDDGDDDGDG